MRLTREADAVKVSRKELAAAAKKFLLPPGTEKDVVQQEKMDSPFGAVDLLFTNKAQASVTAVRIQEGAEHEKYILSSISCFFWLKDFFSSHRNHAAEIQELEMVLFAPVFSAAAVYLFEMLCSKFKIRPVKYHILHVEDLKDPAIFFQDIAGWNYMQSVNKESVAEEKEAVSARELQEFRRLKESYIDGLVTNMPMAK